MIGWGDEVLWGGLQAIQRCIEMLGTELSQNQVNELIDMHMHMHMRTRCTN